MELENLKSGWLTAGSTLKNEADLLKMTKITNHPSLKRVRRKLLIETLLLIFLLVVYYDWFDGDKKPFYANLLLVLGLLLYIANDALGYISLLRPVRGINLKLSIENYLGSVKRLSVFSLVISFLYGISLIVFFASVIDFTREKRLILLGIIITLFQVLLWSARIWNKRIKALRQQVKDLDSNESAQ
jgi:hypothetical protein